MPSFLVTGFYRLYVASPALSAFAAIAAAIIPSAYGSVGSEGQYGHDNDEGKDGGAVHEGTIPSSVSLRLPGMGLTKSQTNRISNATANGRPMENPPPVTAVPIW